MLRYKNDSSVGKKEESLGSHTNCGYDVQMILVMCSAMCSHLTLINEQRVRRPISINRLWTRMGFLYDLIFDNNVKCFSQLRMDRQTFTKLCNILHAEGGFGW